MNIDEIKQQGKAIFKKLIFANAIKLLEINEINGNISPEVFFSETTKNSADIAEILGLEVSSIEIADLINIATAVQLEIFKYLQKISKKRDRFAEVEGNGETCCPFFRSLQSIKFSFAQVLNSSVFEIDKALFTEVIDNIEAYLFFNNTSNIENNNPRVIRQHASDTDLF